MTNGKQIVIIFSEEIVGMDLLERLLGKRVIAAGSNITNFVESLWLMGVEMVGCH